MIDLSLQNFVDYYVKTVMKIKNGYGYRVILKYQDGSEKIQQKAGFHSEKEAKKAREQTIGELYSGTYVVYANVKVADFLEYWLEDDIKKRAGSYNTYYSFGNVVKNHIAKAIGKKKMVDINKGDIQKLYNDIADYSVSVAKQVKSIMNISFDFAVEKKVIPTNPATGVNLPKNKVQKSGYHTRNIDTSKTLTLDQINLLIEKSKDTKIYLMVLMNVLMGLRCSEIIAVKYSDVDYVNRTLSIERQLGRVLGGEEDDYAPKTLTKQEVRTKTKSSVRELPIPDVVFEAILKERKQYEANRRRRSTTFQDLDYICCSTYGRPRSKNYHWQHYKKLLADNGLPDIRWHDLRSTYCTLLLKNNYSPKAVSKLMGHAKEIITMDVYGDNRNLIAMSIPELEAFVDEVIPAEKIVRFREDLLDIEIDVSEYLPAL